MKQSHFLLISQDKTPRTYSIETSEGVRLRFELNQN